MSDDEEIICEGKCLYNHLVNIGYGDFESFTPSSINNEEPPCNTNCSVSGEVKLDGGCVSSANGTFKISLHEHKKLVTILNSQLLFQEDAHIIESCLSSALVSNQKTNLNHHVSVIATGLLCSAATSRKGINPCIPLCVTGLFSLYSSWCWYREYKKSNENNHLDLHVQILKKLCVSVFKLLRYIKETEILSTGQVSNYNVGSAMYCSLGKYKEKELGLDKLPEWKSLPHLRKCLVDSLVEIVCLLSESIDTLRKSYPSKSSNIFQNNLICIKDPLKAFESIINSEECVSVKDIQALCDTYLVVQSEYLKEIALVLVPFFLVESMDKIGSCTEKVLKLASNLTFKLTNITSKLNMHYCVHNTYLTTKPNKPSDKNSLKSQSVQMQADVHNIYLLLYSALLRVRSLEDYLESVVHANGNQSKLCEQSCDVNKKLEVVQDDLLSTVRCYETLLKQLKSYSKTAVDDMVKPIFKEETRPSSKKTGITVGASDFSVNSPDEVFLAISGINNQESESCKYLDDCCYETKPQVPKSLLTELSNTLKSRKLDFIEREKVALERQGLEDIESESVVSAEDSEEVDSSRKSCNKKYSFSYRRRHRVSSHSSDSDDEMDPFESGMFLKKLKNKKSDFDSTTVTDSDISTDKSHENKESDKPKAVTVSELPFSSSMLANQAIMKSQLWGNASEEHFSDGSDS